MPRYFFDVADGHRLFISPDALARLGNEVSTAELF